MFGPCRPPGEAHRAIDESEGIRDVGEVQQAAYYDRCDVAKTHFLELSCVHHIEFAPDLIPMAFPQATHSNCMRHFEYSEMATHAGSGGSAADEFVLVKIEPPCCAIGWVFYPTLFPSVALLRMAVVGSYQIKND